MARNPDNVKVFKDAWIYLSDATARPALPTDVDTAMGAEWKDVGLLDGDGGIGESRSIDETEKFGWGAGLVKISGKNVGLSGSFTPIEDNPIVRELVWPGSTSSKLKLPKPVYRWLAIETQDDFEDKERLFTIKRARLWVPENTKNESDATSWEVQYRLFADGSGDVFDRQVSAVAGG
ncbi:hypothetical protein [Rhodococcus sp. PD04]|uniref:hypothetical protein n=1 Tax=Rhodococcus sp. PD04 TaxID=3109594 RepID=UPI002DDAC48C|nr:hypothetical protein [Rhodococcus sp. PD04]WSE22326.1 hypothetical protein U9J23_22170 [Rhodococcus sp. PD04]